MDPSSAARFSDPGLSIPAASEAEPVDQAGDEAGRSLWRRTAGYGRKVAPLALSHGLSRVSAFALVVFIGRFLGAAALGEFSLAHALGQYVMLGSDLGAKAIGARMIAADHSRAPAVLPLALRKMVALVLISAAVAIGYAMFGPVPPQWRWFLAVFVLSAVPFALNIDWLFWGLERFDVFAAWQAGVYTAYALLAIVLTLAAAKRNLYGVAAGNALAWIGGAWFLWLRWIKWRDAQVFPTFLRERSVAPDGLAWRSILTVGSTGVGAMVLDNASLFVLGAVGTPRQVGEYGAAAKILAAILGFQTLLWWVVYPWLARRQPMTHGLEFYAWLLPGVAALAGLAVAAPLVVGAHAVVVLCFGVKYVEAVRVLRVLGLLLPFAFAAVMSRAILIAHAQDVLASIGIITSALAGVVLSLLLVPRYGPAGAAWATTVAYALSTAAGLCALLLMKLPRGPQLRDRGGNL
jgi:O-antigen/teichoic acid export membrane protein